MSTVTIAKRDFAHTGGLDIWGAILTEAYEKGLISCDSVDDAEEDLDEIEFNINVVGVN